MAGGCPSNTHLQSSQALSPFNSREAKFAIDWLETRGCILWDESISREQFWRLDQLQQIAKDSKQAQQITLGPMTGFLHGFGIGSGSQVHLEYRFDYRGVMFALSSRAQPSRQLSNFYLKISGEPCLIEGAHEARAVVLEAVKALGGVVNTIMLRG